MFTSFILVHQDGEPMMINIMDISFIKDNLIFLKSMDEGLDCDESFQELNEKLCAEIGG